MKILNDIGWPLLAKILRGMNRAPTDEWDVSSTELCDSPKIKYLKEKHWDQLQVKASDQLWALHGTGIHAVIEREIGKLCDPDIMFEVRMIQNIGGMRVSGQIDVFDKGTGLLWDIKNTSAWRSVSMPIQSWIDQVNIYAHLLRKDGHEVKGARIWAFYRDWSKKKAEQSVKYSDTKSQVIAIKLRPFEVQQAWMEDRVRLFLQYRDSPQDYQCTLDERWGTPKKWAVMVPGRKRAKRLVEDQVEAMKLAKSLRGKVETRVATNRRCEEYCVVAGFCRQNGGDNV